MRRKLAAMVPAAAPYLTEIKRLQAEAAYRALSTKIFEKTKT